MTWEAVAAIGQAAGAIGVICSLLYLAGQVRHARRAVNSASADVSLASAKEFIRMLIDDPEAARIFGNGQVNPATLSEVERYRFTLMANFYLMMTENVWWHWSEGALAPDLWESMRLKMTSGIAQPGIRSVWNLRRDSYSTKFRAFVDAALAESPIESIEKSARRLAESESETKAAAPDATPADSAIPR